MPLQIRYATPATGAEAGYHVVTSLALDYEMKISTATVSSFLSKDAKDAGKFAMYAQQIQISDLPDEGVDARDFAETSLAAAPPVDGSGFVSANRFAFAGAQIVE
ncbi:hypothetical protein [Paraburkholderia caledonica]|uniref:hypothetical protein n=1 Tax=Paraburkholderia caledonica TaxID=134536 RepID=UPI000B3FBF22|nr:hypothetical protein [Paraburkholderia caledonica]